MTKSRYKTFTTKISLLPKLYDVVLRLKNLFQQMKFQFFFKTLQLEFVVYWT